jgi:SPP1 family phage portal protein
VEITHELLLQCLEAFRAQQAEKDVYQRYYNGKHDVLTNYTFSPNRANMKIVVNWFKKFLHDELGFSLNNPVNYIDKKGNLEFVDRIDLDFSTWEKVHNQKLMLKANTYGFAFELKYLTKDNEFKATVLDPMNCFVLEGNDVERTPLLAIHLYKENQFSDKELVDVYLPNYVVQHYEIDGDNLNQIGESKHAFPTVPVYVVEANTERKSMLDDIKDLCDSYNETISNMVNELSDFRLALLKIIGTRFENEEDIAKMVEKGAIELQTGADIDYLIKNLPDAFANSTLKEIKENLFRQSGHVDSTERMQSNLSGNALMGRMITLTCKMGILHNMLEMCIKARLKDYFYILNVRERVEYDYRLISQKFTLTIPHDLQHLGDVFSKLQKGFALTTLYSLFPFVENPQLEYEKFLKQRETLMDGQVDLEVDEE